MRDESVLLQLAYIGGVGRGGKWGRGRREREGRKMGEKGSVKKQR